MNLKGCITVFVTLAVSTLIVCGIVWGIVWWNDITVKEVWSNYISKPEPWVGVFTSIGAIFTVFVFIVTAYASLKSGESAKIAAKALELSYENSRKDDYIKQFTLLLEQHNNLHKSVVKYIDSLKNNKGIISDSDDKGIIRWDESLEDAANKLYQNYNFSIYMITLYRLLKHIDENFYKKNSSDKFIKEKKEYSSIVRSVIRNDVLFLIAINSFNKNNSFKEYKKKLEKFSFFKHMNAEKISDKIIFNENKFINEFKNSISNLIDSYIDKKETSNANSLLPSNISILMINYLQREENKFLKNKIEEVVNQAILCKVKELESKSFKDKSIYFYLGTSDLEDGGIVDDNLTASNLEKLNNINNIKDFNNLEMMDAISVGEGKILFFSFQEYEDGSVNKNVKYYSMYKEEIKSIISVNILKKENKKIFNYMIENLNKSELVINLNMQFIINESNKAVLCMKKSCSKV